ncbi:PREDICTED: uncharacterized protein LOC109583474 [Amphimedon queenslandica]|uniref:Ig-like domain-containing protein n=1 Tax=Amphimedon queenslandica TaxID=400682 RepID=A0AAN0JCI0_AMPQE|nr:PREDICTED: uncharacterized protein LOC109583474 [Amphimedon queenslandica]|eukprot:XP_019854413.1 PREDICTED: uncharacterized protein LOC109583474 [Amphimedon queenslandica]
MTRVINLWLWLAVMPFLTDLVKSGVEVTFTSTPDPPTIDEGNTVVFNCSSNHSLVTISWLLNKTVSASSLTSRGVIVNGVGTPVSSLIMPGLVDPFNNTEVQCVAFGYGIGHFSPSSVILRVQGVLSEVGNLSCKQTDDDCIECSWEAPFTIQHYIVNIDIANIEKTETLISNSTTVSYCPKQYCQQYGQYNISVAADSSAGLSAATVSFDIVDLRPSSTWENVHILNSSTRQGQWNFTFTASTTSFLAGDYNIIAHFNDTTNASGNAKVNHQGQVSGTIRTGKIDKRKWNMLISLEYGTSILISEPVEINTFGVQESNVTVEDLKICVGVEFIDGSDTMECLVEYKCSSGHNHGTISITRENPCVCTKEVNPSNYTVTLYVGCFNEPDKIFAVWDIIVMETISVIISPSSSFGLPSSTTPADANEASFPTGLVIALVSVVIFIIIVIGIVMAFFSTKKNRFGIGKASKKKHEHNDKEVKLVDFNPI